MASNPLGIKPLSSFNVGMFGAGSKRKRSLGQGDKNQLYERANGKCEACGNRIRPAEMQVGHASRSFAHGGATSLDTTVALCYACNRLMRTKTYYRFMKEMGYTIPKRLRAKVEAKKEKAKGKKAKKRRAGSSYALGMPSFKTPTFKAPKLGW